MGKCFAAKHRVFSILGAALLAAVAAMGQGQTQLTLIAPAPDPPSCGGSVSGTPGTTLVYYFVVATYPPGAVVSAPIPVPNTQYPNISATNSVTIRCNSTGATNYAFLISTISQFPGSCAACLVQSGSGTTATDTGVRSSYTFSSTILTPASTTMTLNNLSAAVPFLALSSNGGSRIAPLIGTSFTQNDIVTFGSNGTIQDSGVTISSLSTSCTITNGILYKTLTGTSCDTNFTWNPASQFFGVGAGGGVGLSTFNTPTEVTDELRIDSVSGKAYIVFANQAAPGTPLAGATRVYVDSTQKVLSSKNDGGTVSHTVQTQDCGALTQVVVAITATGSVTCNTASAGGQLHSISIVIDGGGSAIATGTLKDYINVDYACTINRYDIAADQSGSITIDVWKAAGAIPNSGNKISASAPITLSSSQLNQNGSRTGWTNTVAVGDVFGFSVATATTVTHVDAVIWCQ